jgi:hypothetical protein
MSSSRSAQPVFAFGAKGTSEAVGASNKTRSPRRCQLSEAPYTLNGVVGSLGATK